MNAKSLRSLWYPTTTTMANDARQRRTTNDERRTNDERQRTNDNERTTTNERQRTNDNERTTTNARQRTNDNERTTTNERQRTTTNDEGRRRTAKDDDAAVTTTRTTQLCSRRQWWRRYSFARSFVSCRCFIVVGVVASSVCSKSVVVVSEVSVCRERVELVAGTSREELCRARRRLGWSCN